MSLLQLDILLGWGEKVKKHPFHLWMLSPTIPQYTWWLKHASKAWKPVHMGRCTLLREVSNPWVSGKNPHAPASYRSAPYSCEAMRIGAGFPIHWTAWSVMGYPRPLERNGVGNPTAPKCLFGQSTLLLLTDHLINMYLHWEVVPVAQQLRCHWAAHAHPPKTTRVSLGRRGMGFPHDNLKWMQSEHSCATAVEVEPILAPPHRHHSDILVGACMAMCQICNHSLIWVCERLVGMEMLDCIH